MARPVEPALEVLSRLGAQPATSFYEAGVASVVQAVLLEMGVDFRTDRYGSIIARVPGVASQGEKEGTPPIAYVAHMDHPGFEAVATDGDFLVARALGGVPAAGFEAGLLLQVVLEDGRRMSAVTAGHYGPAEGRQVLVQLGQAQPVSLPRPVVFDLVDFQLEGDFIRMRALDDLAGCGSILAALSLLKEEGLPGDVYGVFTRAEEVGLVGARLLGEARTLPPDTLVVSLESSRTLPGAEIGSGPVIRVGDAGFTFNADAEAALIKARETLQARLEGFKVQRQLMSGGTCEASAFALHGYQTTGIAFPLGNYHNGAPEGRIEAEYIHRDDFLGGIQLIVESARSVAERSNTAFRRRLAEVPPEFRQRLAETAS
jgi:putative aminopeptidase FrvX